MLIITRYTRDTSSRYHNIGSLSDAISIGSDMISLPVRTTADKKLILAAKSYIGPKKLPLNIKNLSLKQLQRATAGGEQPITTLANALKNLYEKTIIELEIFEWSSVAPLIELLKQYAKRKKDWSTILITSENPILLLRVRKLAPHAMLCLKHGRYPLSFATWHPILNLSAVGFRRLKPSQVAIEAAHKLNLLIYVYTVNRKNALTNLKKIGIDAVVTNSPKQLL